jgi:lipoprotein-releasing system permease protein
MSRFFPFEWIAALRFLKEGRMQTLFIITGVAIGVGVIIFMSALLSSLQANFIKRVLTSQPHIQIIPPDETARPLRPSSEGVVYATIVQRPTQRLRSIDQWQRIRQQLLAREDVAEVSPTVSASALAVRGDASRSITLTGIDPDVYFNIVKLPEYIIQGQARVTSEDIIIGKELANDLGVSLGDKVNVTAASKATRSLTISAIFDLGNKGANERSTFVALRTAQALSNLVGGVTTIDVTVHEVYSADVIAAAIQADIGMQADSWITTNAQFFTAVNAQKTSNTAIRGFVGLSVAFGIASVLVVSVIQRSKDIGILRAMGASQGQILRVFLLQGGLLGFFGAIVGSALGGQGIVLLHNFMRQADGTELFPLVIESSLFVVAIMVATITGVVAATVPAFRAAKLDPVAAIRG